MNASSSAEIIDETSRWIVGGGIVTIALFPLALPLIALTAIAAIPLLLIALVAGVIAAAVAAPIVLVRRLVPRATRMSSPTSAVEPGRP
jgi:hypothetical protein